MFNMPIDDVFAAKDGTVVVVGRVEAGEVRPGDRVAVHTPARTLEARVMSLEGFGRIRSAIAGDNVGVRLSGVDKAEIAAGSRLAGG